MTALLFKRKLLYNIDMQNIIQHILYSGKLQFNRGKNRQIFFVYVSRTMEAAAVVDSIIQIQEAFKLISVLQLTYYLFPKQAVVVDGQRFDYVIVGGGTAGCVLANRLSENPEVSVLLIEAGGDPPIEAQLPGLPNFLLHSRLSWNFTTEPDTKSQICHKNNVGFLSSGKVLGGSSSIGLTQYYTRGSPSDYDDWAEIVDDCNWNWNHTLPYFMKSEGLKDHDLLSSPYGDHYGTNGPVGIEKEHCDEISKYISSFKELNYPTANLENDYCNLGELAKPLFTILHGTRQSTAYSYLSPIKDRLNLHVLKQSLVEEILFDSCNNAVGVKVSTAYNKTIKIYANIEVILSAGSINSPKLLMLSGIGPREHLLDLGIPVRSDLPVGFNYQNHLFVITHIKTEYSNAPVEPINPYLYDFPSLPAYINLNKSQINENYLTVNVFTQHDSQSLLENCAFYYGYQNRICQDIFDKARGRNTMTSYITLVHPKSRGRVTLRSRNFADSPIIDARILQDERDVDSLTAYLKDFLRVLNTTYFKNVNAEIVVPDLDLCSNHELWSDDYTRCYVRCMVSTLQHYVGTCSMGSVVDTHLRVRGVRRLRVVDGSVMPKIVGVSTGMPIVMIAEKAADIIKNSNPDDIQCCKQSADE